MSSLRGDRDARGIEQGAGGRHGRPPCARGRGAGEDGGRAAGAPAALRLQRRARGARSAIGLADGGVAAEIHESSRTLQTTPQRKAASTPTDLRPALRGAAQCVALDLEGPSSHVPPASGTMIDVLWLITLKPHAFAHMPPQD